VNYWKLFNQLLSDGVDVHLVKLLAYWYVNQEVSVRWLGTSVTKILQHQGHATPYRLEYPFFHTYCILVPLPSWETAFGRRRSKHQQFPQYHCETHCYVLSLARTRKDLAFFRLPTALSEQSKVPF